MPSDDTSLQFGPYRLHPVQGLTQDNREIRITPKSLAVLYVLARRSGEIVTKKELFETAWADRLVTDAALSSCIRELRQALGDDARNPDFLETVHRRGFRFLPACKEVADERSVPDAYELLSESHKDNLDHLTAFLSNATDRTVRLAALRGDLGSGKSALVDALAMRLSDGGTWQVGRGACDELSGRGDAYQPLLRALTSLCLQPGGVPILSQLRLYAPTWLAELTAVLQPAEIAAQRRITSGVTTARFHRELDAALTAIAKQRPVLLALEDLEWCDAGTLEWLAGLEERVAEPIVVLATHAGVPFDAEFTLQLDSIDDADEVGNFDRLGERDRQVLAAAGILGTHFSDVEVSGILDLPRQDVVDALSGLVASGELIVDARSDRGIGDAEVRRYRFSSKPRRARLIAALPLLESRRLQRRAARTLESLLGEIAADRAPELAVRYEQAYDLAHAVRSYQDAATLCRRRGSHRIAQAHLRRALALLPAITDSTERSLWDAQLHTAAGGAFAAEKGLADDDIVEHYETALGLAVRMPASQRLFTILWQIWVFYFSRGPLAKAHDLASRLSEVAGALDDPGLELSVHHAFWGTALMLGDVRDVLHHSHRALELCGSGLDGASAITSGCALHDAHVSNHHAAVCAGFCGAWAHALAGNEQDARQAIDTTIAHARDFGHPFSLAMALVQSAGALTACDDAVNTRRYADEGAAIAGEHGFDVFQAWAGTYAGWATARLGGIREGLAMMQDSLDALRDSGLYLFRPYQLALVAELELENSMYDSASRSLDEAFSTAERVGDRLAAAELHRLRGEVAIATARSPADLAQAESDLRAGLDIATASGAGRFRNRAEQSLERFDRGRASRRSDNPGKVSSITELEDRRRGRDA